MQNLTRRASAPPPVSKESIKPTILEENATEMFTNINDVENKKLLEGLSDMLNNENAIIAGGAILSIINDEVVSDYDLYVHKKYAKEIIKYLLDNTGDLRLEVKNNTPAYDQSFFKKNNIIGRLLFKVNDDINIDLIIVRDDTKLIDVVSNFDLTFCEVWYDGNKFYANYPEHVRQKKGFLKPDYVQSLLNNNTFIARRIRKYRRRSYKIEISCKNNIPFIDKLRKNDIINSEVESRKEEWAVSFIMKSVLSYLNFEYVKENIVDFILEKNTKENLTSLFENLKNKYNEDDNVTLFKAAYPFIGNTPHLYLYLCYVFYNNVEFCIDGDIWKTGKKWFNYLRAFLKHYSFYYEKGEDIRKSILENSRIRYNLIGEEKSHDIHNDGLYSIKMSRDFVKCTQYKPYIQLDNDTKQNIQAIENSGNGDVHLIYACPDGHLHASNNCGVPTTISKCGYPTDEVGGSCQNYVGGLYHMLVPGNYIVKHDNYQLGYLYYGKFPVYTYKTYKQIYEQAKKAIEKCNEIRLEDILEDLSPISENKDGTITAKKYTVGLQLRDDNNDTCFVCAEEFSKTDQGGYDASLTEDDELYILPCGHLIHKGCLATARGLNEDDFNPENINDDVDVSGRVCPYTTCNRNRFLFGRKQSLRANQTVRKRSYVKLAGSIRRNRIRTNKRSKKLRKLPFRQREAQIYRFGKTPREAPELLPLMAPPNSFQKTPLLTSEKTNEKKYTRGYITWHKWQEELKENGERKELVINKDRQINIKKIEPLASEMKIKRKKEK